MLSADAVAVFLRPLTRRPSSESFCTHYIGTLVPHLAVVRALGHEGVSLPRAPNPAARGRFGKHLAFRPQDGLGKRKPSLFAYGSLLLWSANCPPNGAPARLLESFFFLASKLTFDAEKKKLP